EGNVALQAVEQHAGIEFQRATGNRPIEHGDQFVAKLRRAFNRFLRIFRRAETNIGHPMLPLELLEHVVSADSVAAIERMQQAAVDPENPQALRIGNRRWRHRAGLRLHCLSQAINTPEPHRKDSARQAKNSSARFQSCQTGCGNGRLLKTGEQSRYSTFILAKPSDRSSGIRSPRGTNEFSRTGAAKAVSLSWFDMRRRRHTCLAAFRSSRGSEWWLRNDMIKRPPGLTHRAS